MKILLGITGIIVIITLSLFVMEIKDELEDERRWRNRGRQ